MQTNYNTSNDPLFPKYIKDSGKEGVGHIKRTPTGVEAVVFGYGTAEEVTMELKREVDLDGNPYIEIELDGLDEDARQDVLKKIEQALLKDDYHEGL